MGFKNLGKSFCERELLPFFSSEKQRESFFLKRSKRERERERERESAEEREIEEKKIFFIQPADYLNR